MTVIAFRDGVMAADTCAVWFGDLKDMGCHKIMRAGKKLIACAGIGCPSDAAALKWYKEGMPPWPEMNFVMLIAAKKGLKLATTLGGFDLVKAEYFAIGAGAQCAMGAMYMGASAEEAVQAAIKHIDGCAGDVDVESLR